MEGIGGGSLSSVRRSLFSSMTSRSTGEMGERRGRRLDGRELETLQLRKGYVAAFADLYLFVR